MTPTVAPIVQGSANINLDSKTLEQCLKSTTSFGQTVYTNLCTGAQTAVPWGGADWTLAIFLMLAGAVVLGVGVAFAKMAWSDL